MQPLVLRKHPQHEEAVLEHLPRPIGRLRLCPHEACAEQPAHLRLAEAAVARPGVADLVDESRGLLTEAARNAKVE